MNYIIKSKKNSLKLANHNIKLKGLSVKGNKYKNYDESIITICDKDMINAFIKKKLNKRVQKLIAFMIGTLNDPDSTDSDVNFALDEANKLKGILFNKYKEHMKIEEYKEILSKIFTPSVCASTQ